MLKLCYDMGAKLQIMNNRNLTPLTLAAHLAKKEVSYGIILKRVIKIEKSYVRLLIIEIPTYKLYYHLVQELSVIKFDIQHFICMLGQFKDTG